MSLIYTNKISGEQFFNQMCVCLAKFRLKPIAVIFKYTLKYTISKNTLKYTVNKQTKL